MSQINVTPFVDVMLVLLIIFMVTAPMMQQGVQVNLPKADAKALTPPGGNRHRNPGEIGKSFINKSEVAHTDLKTRLSSMFAGKTKKKCFSRQTLMFPMVKLSRPWLR